MIKLDERAKQYAEGKSSYAAFQQNHIADYKAGFRDAISYFMEMMINYKDYTLEHRDDEIYEELLNIIEDMQESMPNSYSTFEKTFKPIMSDNNDGLKQFDTIDELPVERDVRKIWTICDEDGTTFLSPGIRMVNRLAYVLTKESWTDENQWYYY